MPRRIRLRVQTKIMIPAVLLAIVPILALMVIGDWRLKEAIKVNVDAYCKNRITAFENNLKQQSDQSMTMASAMANLPEVKRGYSVFHSDSLHLDLGESKMIIENLMTKVRNGVDNDISEDLMAHFHLPKSISFYRTWSDQFSDDLSRFRKSITIVNRRRKAVSGLEIGKNGLYIRGVAPIMSNDRQIFYGTVEILLTVKKLLEQSCINPNDQFAIFALNSKLTSINKKLLPNSYLERIGDFSLVDESSSDFRLANLDGKLLFNSYGTKERYFSFVKGGFQYAGFPMLDISGQKIGVVVYQYNDMLISQQLSIIRIVTVSAALLIILTIISIMYLVAKQISKPIVRLGTHVQGLGEGKIISPIANLSDDEIGEMGASINQFVIRLIRLVDFSNDVAHGTYTARFEQHDNRDLLGQALVNMQTSLMKVKEEAYERELVEEQNKMLSEGRAKIGEILRENIDKLDSLSENLIIYLVKFFKATQGGLFVVGDDDKSNFLQMKAAYAYERRKFLTLEFEIGKGLVGVCAFERETTYLKEIPKEYISIQSGLGGANPRVLLLLPLVFNEELFGVIELASFNEFGDYEIEFLESVSETIASSLSTVKINAQTANLLKTHQKQSEIMRVQELEMRRSFEEMQELQKEASLNEKNLKRYVDTLDKSVLRFVVNETGTILEINDLVLELGDWQKQEMIGVHFLDLIYGADRARVLRNWKDFAATEEQSSHFELRFDIVGGIRWVNGIFTRSFAIKSKEEQYVFIGINIHDIKQREIILQNKIDSIQTAVLYSEFDTEGFVKNTADLFVKALAYSKKEIEGKAIFDFQTPESKKEAYQLWMKLKNGYPAQRKEEYLNNFGDKKVFQGTYIPTFDEQGRFASVVHIASDITKLDSSFQKMLSAEERLAISKEKAQDVELELNLSESRLGKLKKDFAFYKEEQSMRHKKEKVDYEIQKEELKKEIVALHAQVNQLEMERNVQKVNYEKQLQTITQIFEEDRKKLNRSILKLEREIGYFKGRRAENI